jgi:hypothetical protein
MTQIPTPGEARPDRATVPALPRAAFAGDEDGTSVLVEPTSN